MATQVQRLSIGLAGAATSGSFREFVRFVQSAFSASGFLNLTVSGTINSTTVDPPTLINQERGYEVYAFNDALQSSSPFYIRVGYRSGGSINTFGCAFRIGELQDNSGSVNSAYTPIAITSSFISNTGFSVPQSASCLYSGESGSRVFVGLYANISGTNSLIAQTWWNISRTRDWNGVRDGRGVELHFGGGSGSSNTRAGTCLVRTDSYGYSYNTVNKHNVLLTLQSGSTPILSPSFVGKAVFEPVSPDVLFTRNIESAFPAPSPAWNVTGSQVTINMYGQNRNYVRFNTAFGGSQFNTVESITDPVLLVRYE